MLTNIDRAVLAAAFPQSIPAAALLAGTAGARCRVRRQRTTRFVVQVAGETVLIPERLHFASDDFPPPATGDRRLVASALLTRSNDGFQRQRAARNLLANVRPWLAPFIAGLVGEYVVEILEDIDSALTADGEQVLAAFIRDNFAFWETIRDRVTSYWNAYYRHAHRSDSPRAYTRADYIGFRLIDRLERATTSAAP